MSEELDLTEAIEAAAWAVDPVDGAHPDRRPLEDAVRAAAPLIERKVRNRIAAELDQQGQNPGRVETFADQIWWQAAEIARGQP